MAGTAWALVVAEPAGWVVWACATGDPAKVSNVTMMAPASHSATAAAAIAGPGLARMLSQLIHWTARADSPAQVESACRTTRRRYATASSVVEEHRRRTLARSSGGSGGSGTRPDRTVGRSAPRVWLTQIWHVSRCQ